MKSPGRVSTHHPLSPQQHIVWLDVTMDDVEGVEILQARSNTNEDVEAHVQAKVTTCNATSHSTFICTFDDVKLTHGEVQCVNQQLTIPDEGIEVLVWHELVHQQLLHQVLLSAVLVTVAEQAHNVGVM